MNSGLVNNLMTNDDDIDIIKIHITKKYVGMGKKMEQMKVV